MADTFQLEVATPERLLVDEQVTQAELPGLNGYMGILAGHAPLMSALGAGVLSYEGGGGPHVLAIAGGFVEVSDNHVRVLADEAEAAQDIQIDKARKDLDEASQALRQAKETADSEAALRAMQRAQARIDAVERSGSSATRA
jgi:F-type H+-transporting ATPase subunit epsilon